MNLADRASSHLLKGIREIAGPSSHPQILAWLQRTEKLYPTDLTIDDSKYAWCGVFVGNMVLDERVTNPALPPPPKYFQAAARWREWGTAVPFKSAQRGDVVVLRRPGGFHVAIVSGITHDGITHDGIKVIGGNQSDSLSVAEYPWPKVVAVRRGL